MFGQDQPKFKPGDYVRWLWHDGPGELGEYATVLLSSDPMTAPSHRVAVRFDDYKHYRDGAAEKSPENPEGLDYHAVLEDQLELVTVDQEELDQAVESILRAVKEKR